MSEPRDADPRADPTDHEGFVREPWCVVRALRDGTQVTLRPLGPEDREGLRDAFRELSPETRYMRFFSVVTEPSEAVLRYLTEVDQRDHVAIAAIATTPDLKSERGVGVARFVRVKGEPHVAEAAVTVIGEYQRRGLGAVLLIELTRAAIARGIRVFRGEVLSSNTAMLAILHAVGAKLEPSDDTGPLSPDAAPSSEDMPSLQRGHTAMLAPALRFEVTLEGGEPRPHRLLRLVRAAAESMSHRLRHFVGDAPHAGAEGPAPR